MEASSLTTARRSVASQRRLRARVGAWIRPLVLDAALLLQLLHDPTQTLDDVKTGLSNGTIWALIALGYTLVYGIIELINDAVRAGRRRGLTSATGRRRGSGILG